MLSHRRRGERVKRNREGETDRRAWAAAIWGPLRARVSHRAATVVAASVAVAVLVTGCVATESPSIGREASDRVAAPSRGPSPSSSSQVPVDSPWEDDRIPVRYLDGELQVRPGGVVHQSIDNPYRWPPPGRSDALDLTLRGTRSWLISGTSARGFEYKAVTPGIDGLTFDEWVSQQARLHGARGYPPTIRLREDGRVVAASGAEIVQRTDDPQLGANFAPAGTPTGAATVTVDEQSYFVVWRITDGEIDVITVPPADVVGATFAELLSYARGRLAAQDRLR